MDKQQAARFWLRVFLNVSYELVIRYFNKFVFVRINILSKYYLI